MTNDERIYAEAAKYLGIAEVPGSGSNPNIVRFIDEAATWLKDGVKDVDGSIAWCGCFRGHVGIITATGVPKNHFRAAEWATWGAGIPLQPKWWKRGMTVVMSRPGGNHVAIIDRVEGDTVYCLGGNQSDKVCIAAFPVSRITSVRTSA